MNDLNEPTSSDASPDPLDGLLRRGLSEQLDRHVGRAAQAFLDSPHSTVPPVQRAAPALRLRWAAPLLAAAAIALVAAPIFRNSATGPSPAGPLAIAPSPGVATPDVAAPSNAQPQLTSYDPKDIGAEVQWADVDEGMVWLDDQTPARKIRRQRLETLQWTDPHDSTRIEVTIPREEIVLVSSPRL